MSFVREKLAVYSFESLPGTYPVHWSPVLLHHHFLQYSQITPDAYAVISVNNQWTYKELSAYAYRYATVLDSCGLATGDRVVLELDPCPQAVALIAACSMLGLVFVPVSPESPQARVEHILQITEARLHIQVAPGSRSIPAQTNLLRGFLNGNSLQVDSYLPEALRSRKGPVIESDLAYIIFTSGTTGQPKGIMMSHRAILAFFRGLVDHCKLEPTARVGTISPLQFDFSLLDMGLAFGSGATLVEVPRILIHQPKRLVQYLEKHRVSQMNGVPSIWRMILRYASEDIAALRHLQSILFAGEPFPIPDLVHLRALIPHLRIINCFGQSESIACSFTDVPCPLLPETENLSIGFAHPGTEMLLMDDQGHEIQEPAKVGEIYLRGASLFSGYWQNPEATEAALVPNPLRPFAPEKIFRTGDLAYKGLQGEIYCCGRRDLQVKILGNRVELEEVERRLCTHPAILQAAVIAVKRQENPMLVAYVVLCKDKSALTTQELRLFCKETLPIYMLPSEIHFRESLPLTTNGKVNRKALENTWECVNSSQV